MVLFNVSQTTTINETKIKEIKIPTEKSKLINLFKTYEIGKTTECFFDPLVKSKILFSRPRFDSLHLFNFFFSKFMVSYFINWNYYNVHFILFL